jgi:hypothetical protein
MNSFASFACLPLWHAWPELAQLARPSSLTYFLKNNITVAHKHNLDRDNFYTKIVDFDYLLAEKEHLVRKLHTRPEVTSSNPRSAHACISREKITWLVTWDVRL